MIICCIEGGNEAGVFYVGPKGKVFTKLVVDREKKASYRLLMQVDSGTASSSSSSSLSASKPFDLADLSGNQILLDVRVADENDNPPRFVTSGTGVDGLIGGVAPTTSVGDIVLKAEAVDADEGLNAVVRYGIISEGEDAAKFIVDETTGVVR